MTGNNKNTAGLVLPLILLAIGGVIYAVFLWFPFGGWIFDNITVPDFGISTKSVVGLLLVIFLGIVNIMVTVSIFVLPYIVFCAMVIKLWLRYQTKKENISK